MSKVKCFYAIICQLIITVLFSETNSINKKVFDFCKIESLSVEESIDIAFIENGSVVFEAI